MNLPRYPNYKESCLSCVGKVPGHWACLQLKRLGAIRYGIGEPPSYREEGVPLIRATNVHAGKVLPTGMVFVDPNDIPSQRIVWLTEGDIIVVRSGAYTGDSAIITEEYEGAIAGFDMVLRLHGCLPSFAQYALLSPYLKAFQIDLQRMRAAQPHLNAEELGECRMVLPPREEQAAIVAFLDRETGKTEALIAEQEKLLILLAEKRLATVSHAVTRGLNPDAPLKDSGVAWLGQTPAHWNVAPLGYRYNVQLGKMLDSTKITGEHLRPYLRVFDVQWGAINTDELPVMDFDEDARAKFRLVPGDILVNEGGSYPGRSAIWTGALDEVYYQKALHRIRPYCSENDTTRFFYYVMSCAANQGVFVSGGNETTIEHLPAEKLRRYRFAFPPITEQLRIAEFLDAEILKLDGLKTEAERAIELLKERRSALIAATVTGKIDVREHVTVLEAAA
jgi:type I restriction enzyme, S subunit